MEKWSWLNKDKTEIVETWTNGGRQYRSIDGHGTSNYFPPDVLLADGALPHIYPELIRWQSHGALVIEVDRVSCKVVAMSTADIRISLEGEIYQRSQNLLSAATSDYSAAEMSQWAEMTAQAESANWSYFDAMATPGMTGQEYGQVVLLKHAALKAYFDAVIAARNTHKVNLVATADNNLTDYDTSLLWPGG